MLISFLLFFLGIFLFLKQIFGSKKPKPNPYISAHEKKLRDDEEYNDYLEWCKKNGELPADKNVFYKHSIKGLKDDEDYQTYVRWCKKNGEIPVQKTDFDKNRTNRL